GAPAVALDDLAVLLRRDGLGALERDVLEDVREPGVAEALVARADAVVELEDNRGGLVILEEDQFEAVVERRLGGALAVRRGANRARRQRDQHCGRTQRAHPRSKHIAAWVTAGPTG